MRKLLVVAAFMLFIGVSAAVAGGAGDVLLTPGGTLFQAQAVDDEKYQLAPGDSAIQLRVQRDGEVETFLVPASNEGGNNGNPALAWDEETESLFLFWVRAPHLTTSELRFCSFRDGKFSEATTVDQSLFRFRTNLRIAVTRSARVERNDDDEDEGPTSTPALAIHAVWWDSSSRGEGVRYAMLGITNGQASIIEVRDVIDYLGKARNSEPLILGEDFDRHLLRYPSVSTNPAGDSVDIVFADWQTSRINRVEIISVSSGGVLKPPVGVSRGEIGAPVMESVSSSSSVATIARNGKADVVLYQVQDGRVQYFHFDGTKWRPSKFIALDDVITETEAVTALQRLVEER